MPFDGSDFALQAMPTARALAQRFSAVLHMVSVVRGDRKRDRALSSGADSLGVALGDDRVCVVPEGDPAEVIAQRAEALGSCLVCITTNEHGRLHGALVGSVTHSLLQRGLEQIVVLGPSADNPGWSPRPRNWPEPLSVPRIVVCVDGSDVSEQVLPLAAAWARVLGMSLTILTAIGHELVPTRHERRRSRYGSDADAYRYIDNLVREWSNIVPHLDGVVIHDPIGPARAIWAHLDQRPASLVALTSSARSGWQRIRHGAVAADIVHASVAPCLVAAVRR